MFKLVWTVITDVGGILLCLRSGSHAVEDQWSGSEVLSRHERDHARTTRHKTEQSEVRTA